jgi:hypothetical protein
LQVTGGSFTESHFRRYFAIAVAPALPMIFEKFGEFGFGHAEMRCLE